MLRPGRRPGAPQFGGVGSLLRMRGNYVAERTVRSIEPPMSMPKLALKYEWLMSTIRHPRTPVGPGCSQGRLATTWAEGGRQRRGPRSATHRGQSAARPIVPSPSAG